MSQFHEHIPSRHSFSTGNMVRLSKRVDRGTLRLVHTKYLLNFLSGMDNSNTA